MTTKRLVPLVLLAVMCGCGSPAAGRVEAIGDRAAVWRTDDDANLAYPTCPRCGADIDRGVDACGKCGGRVHIEAKTIACPECGGSKTCVHCGPAATCVACGGDHVCPICDGVGTWHGKPCPECEGAKTCGACAPGAAAERCGRCGDAHECSNCGGTGVIELR